MPNRKKAEEFILQFMKDIEPTGYNIQQYKLVFESMSDQDFDLFMRGLRDGSKRLPVFKPTYKANGITVENNIKIGPKYGVEFFEPLIVTGERNTPDYQTPVKYMVVDLPYRRQSQTLDKKISLPTNNKVIDELTYQPTGDSKGSKISYPELQVLIGMGLDKSITELFKFRGGDRGGFNAYNAMFLRYGSANLSTLSNYSTGVESTRTLKTYLTAAHLSISL